MDMGKSFLSVHRFEGMNNSKNKLFKTIYIHFGIFNTILSSRINNHLIYVLLELKLEFSALSGNMCTTD